MDDAEAIKRCQQGDREAFRHLVERYQKRAVGHAVAILFDRDDAEDAVQEAFIDAFQAIGRFDTSRTFYQWFYVLLRNRCYKLTAKRRPTENLDDVQLLASQPGTVDEPPPAPAPRTTYRPSVRISMGKQDRAPNRGTSHAAGSSASSPSRAARTPAVLL